MRNACALLSALLFSLTLPLPAQSIVPFIGCPADGQQGPVKPPNGQPKHLAIPQSAAEHLAWYQFNLDPTTPELGTLAPRGWHCFGTYGSNGSTIYVAPELLNADKLIFHKNWRGFTGPAVQLSVSATPQVASKLQRSLLACSPRTAILSGMWSLKDSSLPQISRPAHSPLID